MGETARRAAVATLVIVGIVVLALALWKLRLVLALVFTGFILAAAMRPAIDALRRRAVPGADRAREPARDARAASRRGAGRDGDQARRVARLAAPARGGAEGRRPRAAGCGDRPRGLRSPRWDLLHLRRRGLLDLRAREGAARALRRASARPPQARARHVGPDRPPARRVRPRPDVDHPARRDGPVVAVLAHRPPVLVADR